MASDKANKVLGPGDDAIMIQRTGEWPAWPFLPLKKRDFWEDKTGKSMGVLYDEPRDKHGWRIIHVNMFAIADMPKEIWLKAVAEATKYPTLEALLADGWMVD